ncbi:MAG TPA: M23 family metallopeptidase [Pyrinomonadaceae bacterium]|nr:M23 family metallopeptidase [Pyrinomonadaceae bacterium]
MQPTAKRIVLGLLLPVIVLATFLTALRHKPKTVYVIDTPAPATPAAPTSTPTPGPVVESTPTPTPVETPLPQSLPSPQEPPPASPTPAPNYVGELNLIIPVAGIRASQLIDTFDDARSEGRVHDAIDIPAPAGTQVLAATDGQVIKLFQSERGGTTIYQLSVDRKLVFYYAHLQGYAEGITEGRQVHQGEVIAYVGDTGNAGPGNYHLHFSISVVSDPKRYWEGSNINPYPLLHH